MTKQAFAWGSTGGRATEFNGYYLETSLITSMFTPNSIAQTSMMKNAKLTLKFPLQSSTASDNTLSVTVFTCRVHVITKPYTSRGQHGNQRVNVDEWMDAPPRRNKHP